jgi:ribosomal peptide maturation radical SAM protein 1
MRIVLVDMPWSSIDAPSLALAVLKRRVLDVFPDAEVDVMHGNLDYIDWVADQVGFSFEEYDAYVSSYFSGHSEWIFSAALNEQPRWKVAEFTELLGGKLPEPIVAKARELHELAPLFVGDVAARIAATKPDVVGFTVTFAQNAAALATARAVKALAPGAVTVFGGPNCDGPQGAALHRNFPYVDFVVRGEGELAFPRLLAAVRGDDDVADIAGLCRRGSRGESVANPMEARPLPADVLVTPDFGDYFERHARSVAGTWVEPRLTVESSRGCWWGERHHCTFCGLNGSFMQFRSKSPSRFVKEILSLVERHRILDVWVTDNILDMTYLSSVAPALRDSGCDLRIGYEIKANLRRDQLETLYSAGITYAQPGVENLSSRVLKIMDKGITGCQNVRLLRDSETVGINLNWNYLYGFPGETDADYDSVIEQMPALHHLTPPFSTPRLKVERFSPYFDRPELGFGELRPAEQYRHIYDLPETELADLVYVFDSPNRGIAEDCVTRLRKAIAAWTGAYPSSRLTHCDLDEHIVLIDTRPGFSWRVLDITDPLELAAFRLLDAPHSPAALFRKVSALHQDVTEEKIDALLARWYEIGLVFRDGGQVVHVAPAVANQDLTRLDGTALSGARPLVPALAEPGTNPEPGPPAAPEGTMTLWRDRDPRTRAIPGMFAGRVNDWGDPVETADGLAERDIHAVQLGEMVDLGDPDGTAAVAALAIIRELTGRGIAVEWTLRLPGTGDGWQRFSHLYPPARILSDSDGDAIAAQWRASFHIAKCGYRLGPGFLEIRDRRSGSFRRHVLSSPRGEAGIAPLLRGAPAAAVSDIAKARYLPLDLVHQVGQYVWWMPYRISRWPLSPTMP